MPRLFTLVLLAAVACTTVSTQTIVELPKPSAPADTEQKNVASLIDSTVQVIVKIKGTATDTEGKESEYKSGWFGSGVVYAKTTDTNAPPRSRILSANHVLSAPKPGESFMDWSEDGVVKVTIKEVEFEIRTADNRICKLIPLAMGEDTPEDVATGEALCDAGRVAPIADSVPERGSRVYISGHPLGVEMALVTEGYTSGWYEGYLLVSAPAAPGNSGGPVFNTAGEVVGLLVRGAPRYDHLSMATPLAVIYKRIGQTPPLLP